MFHPVMTIRPDEIVRSGTIQPFSVRSMDPVQFARREIDPFINAIRHDASQFSPGETAMQQAALGITSSAVVPGALGAASVENMPRFWRNGFGQETSTTSKALLVAAGAAGGLLVGFLVSRAMKRRGRR